MKRWSASLFFACTLFMPEAYSAPVADSQQLDLEKYSVEQADYFYTLFLERFIEEPERPDRHSAEYHKRKGAFIENINYALEYNSARNAEGKSKTLNINSFFDTSFSDYRKNYLGRKSLTPEEKKNLSWFSKVMIPEPLKASDKQLPMSIDWREKGVVTPVKNQDRCGSCWVFGTIGSVESYYALQGNPLTSLSEELIGACNGVRPMCEGGLFPVAFNYMVENNYTVCTEESCPYTSGAGRDMGCTNQLMDKCKKIRLPQDMKARAVATGHDRALMEALMDGPVAVAINASLKSFMLYSGGIYEASACLDSRDLDHEVLVVGYGVTEDNIPYWIIKNSWGTEWGEKGYVRMRRGKTGSAEDEYNNMCGITLDALQPVSPKKAGQSSSPFDPPERGHFPGI